ncbi:hypothetical protein BJ165DRAFT_1582749 [Panaeolus papilionaceus]|nr:hypothetical protein BJ165DRAFT_1582749 [Panaeolus papilionaceus]
MAHRMSDKRLTAYKEPEHPGPEPVISDYEKALYWNGISNDPPHLFYRSDLDANPFPHPSHDERWPYVPVKTTCGVFGTPLNPVWHTVAPLIIQYFKKNKVHFSALQAARFLTQQKNGDETLGPIVIWISLYPGKNTARHAQEASRAILEILSAHGVDNTTVEWYEGTVERLLGPPLLPIETPLDPTYHVRHALTPALGVPIAAEELKGRDGQHGQGTIAFYFHENRDREGNPTDRVYAVTCKHILCKDTKTDYLFSGSGAPQHAVYVCGERRYERLVSEIQDEITNKVSNNQNLIKDADDLEKSLVGMETEQAKKRQEDVERARAQIKINKEHIHELKSFLERTTADWDDMESRKIGHTHWAPKISEDNNFKYTLDIGTVELDAEKFESSFIGNYVHIGNRWTPAQLERYFWPDERNSTRLNLPSNNKLRIEGVVPRSLMQNPDCYDSNGNPAYIVGKDGSATDFTFGTYAGLEAYVHGEDGRTTIEAAVYNYKRGFPDFSAQGDSGSLIFTGDGRMLAVLHSGSRTASGRHVTYGTPAHCVGEPQGAWAWRVRLRVRAQLQSLIRFLPAGSEDTIVAIPTELGLVLRTGNIPLPLATSGGVGGGWRIDLH